MSKVMHPLDFDPCQPGTGNTATAPVLLPLAFAFTMFERVLVPASKCAVPAGTCRQEVLSTVCLQAGG
jgi:hypothetical protein